MGPAYIYLSAGAFEYEPMFYTEDFSEMKKWFIKAWDLPEDEIINLSYDELNDYFSDNDMEDKLMCVNHISKQR